MSIKVNGLADGSTDSDRLGAEARTPEELAGVVLAELGRLLPALRDRALKASSEIRQGETAEPRVGEIAEGLSFALDAYRGAAPFLAGRAAAQFPTGGAGALESVLSEILTALKLGDSVRLGDALEHEFGPALETLDEEVRAWIASATGGRSPEGRAAAGPGT